mmetsp:Transcript_19125/g.28207  ORF Transcript_19125/g.28207 Transcript_19125/m.28207 type:complete len:154 (-) Transcript_19125:53-514(-)
MTTDESMGSTSDEPANSSSAGQGGAGSSQGYWDKLKREAGAAIRNPTVLGVAGGAVVAPAVLVGGLHVVGFTGAGVAAGSFAAGMQGPATVAGSWFAAAQSVGAAGLGFTGAAGASAVGCAVGSAIPGLTGRFRTAARDRVERSTQSADICKL